MAVGRTKEGVGLSRASGQEHALSQQGTLGQQGLMSQQGLPSHQQVERREVRAVGGEPRRVRKHRKTHSQRVAGHNKQWTE